VRAGGRKGASRDGVQIRDRNAHIVSTDDYSLGECLRDLLDLAARLLVVGESA
jgi:tRNA (guanine10-N2)-methyltransferase